MVVLVANENGIFHDLLDDVFQLTSPEVELCPDNRHCRVALLSSSPPNARAFHNEQIVYTQLESMYCAFFLKKFGECLVTYYVGICKMKGASGCPVPKAFKHKFIMTAMLPAPPDVPSDPPFSSQEIAAKGGQSDEGPGPSAGATDLPRNRLWNLNLPLRSSPRHPLPKVREGGGRKTTEPELSIKQGCVCIFVCILALDKCRQAAILALSCKHYIVSIYCSYYCLT